MPSTFGAVMGMVDRSLRARLTNAALSNDCVGVNVMQPDRFISASTLLSSFKPAARVYFTGSRTARLLPLDRILPRYFALSTGLMAVLVIGMPASSKVHVNFETA